jgi:hypothetical protein
MQIGIWTTLPTITIRILLIKGKHFMEIFARIILESNDLCLGMI